MERNGRGMQNFTRIGLYRGGQGSGRTVGVYSHLYNMVETLEVWGCVSANGVGDLFKINGKVPSYLDPPCNAI